jgi:sugar phosphate isomerase/epimerase
VRLLVENLTSDPTTPEHLITILDLGHLKNVCICLDLGHAHMTVGIAEAISTLGARIASVHTHDNHAVKDEHLWPEDGTIAWPATVEALKALAVPPAIVLEINHTLAMEPALLEGRIKKAFALFD